MTIRLAALAASVLTLATTSAGSMDSADATLPSYTPVQGVSGNLKSIGSDTMNNLMAQWFEEFRKHYPGVKVEMEGKGSSTAPAALINGQAQLGPMSREMKAEEVDKFEKAFGYKPTALHAAVDALAVFVHRDAPIDTISLEELRKVFSVDGPEMTWGDLGVKAPEWASRRIALYGRNSSSGTYGFFKEHALGNRDFKPSVKEQPGSSSVVQAIATDKHALGYSGVGTRTADVKALKISARKGQKGVDATAANAYSGEYPLARYLVVYINYKPGSGLDPVRAEFVKLLYSSNGQEVVVKDGYFPVTTDTARADLKAVGIKPTF